jgi:hypothetical protein
MRNALGPKAVDLSAVVVDLVSSSPCEFPEQYVSLGSWHFSSALTQ